MTTRTTWILNIELPHEPVWCPVVLDGNENLLAVLNGTVLPATMPPAEHRILGVWHPEGSDRINRWLATEYAKEWLPRLEAHINAWRTTQALATPALPA